LRGNAYSVTKTLSETEANVTNVTEAPTETETETTTNVTLDANTTDTDPPVMTATNSAIAENATALSPKRKKDAMIGTNASKKKKNRRVNRVA
jgi:hypothetical protein